MMRKTAACTNKGARAAHGTYKRASTQASSLGSHTGKHSQACVRLTCWVEVICHHLPHPLQLSGIPAEQQAGAEQQQGEQQQGRQQQEQEQEQQQRQRQFSPKAAAALCAQALMIAAAAHSEIVISGTARMGGTQAAPT